MRRLLIPLAVLAALAAGAGAVLAASGGGSSGLDEQHFRFKDVSASRSSTTFASIPALSGLLVCAADGREVSATVSAKVAGAPLEIRVLVDDVTVMRPGPIVFDPAGHTTSFSFTFARELHAFEANNTHRIDVQWRSTTGGTSYLSRSTLNVLSQRGQAGNGGIC